MFKRMLKSFGLSYEIAMFPFNIGDNGNGDADAASFDSILGVLDDEQTTQNGDDSSKEKNQNQGQLADRFDKLEKSYKEQQEYLRQRNETVKRLEDWRGKIMGMDDAEKQKEIELQLRQRMDEDPIKVVNELVEKRVKDFEDKRLKEIEDRVIKSESLYNASNVISSVNQRYEVDWDKHKDAILSELESINPDLKKSDPEAALLKACKLVGDSVLRPRETDEGGPVYIEGRGTRTTHGNSTIEREAESIKKGIMGHQRKSVFDS